MSGFKPTEAGELVVSGSSNAFQVLVPTCRLKSKTSSASKRRAHQFAQPIALLLPVPTSEKVKRCRVLLAMVSGSRRAVEKPDTREMPKDEPSEVSMDCIPSARPSLAKIP